MGGFKRKKKNAKEQGESQPRTDRTDRHYKNIVIEKVNKGFEEFYRQQAVFPEEEMCDFLEALRRPLPQTFRFAGYKSAAKILVERMVESFLDVWDEEDGLSIDGETITKPAPMPWYPNDQAWFTNLSRSQLRRFPTLVKMHRFLISETESGYVTRQEAVSMIPPLFMDIKSDHAILDLCAAPGSKTAQMIELMHADAAGENPSGVCIANDKNNQRCYMLVHQAKRLNSPCCIITNHDASMFPGVVVKDPSGEVVPLQFDRILADVPCSGDGTMRKNLDIWKKWNPETSCHVHGVQIKILKRGLELLKIGGKLVYSTCSMSPMEDEAVLGWVLSQCAGTVELVDCSATIPGLIRRPGVSNWKVQIRDNTWYTDHADLPNSHTHISKSMFPTPDAGELNLDRAMRFLPHDQDTGGFFVAVLTKTKSLPWETENSKAVQKQIRINRDLEPTSETTSESSEPFAKRPRQHKHQHGTYLEDPFYFYDKPMENPRIKHIVEFFKFESSLPLDRIVSRSDPATQLHPRQLYFVSTLAKKILENNHTRIKFINAGVRCFSKTMIPGKDHPYRMVQDGVEILTKYLSKTNFRYFDVDKEDIIALLSSEYPKKFELSEKLQKQLEEKEEVFGCCLVRLCPDLVVKGTRTEVVLCGWKGAASLRLYISKFERRHFLHIMGAEVPEAIDLKPSSIRGRVESGKESEKSSVNGDSLKMEAEGIEETGKVDGIELGENIVNSVNETEKTIG